MIEKGYNWNIELNEIEKVLKNIVKKGYGGTIELKINGEKYNLMNNGVEL